MGRGIHHFHPVAPAGLGPVQGLASGVSSTYERLYSTADQALYRAKASGRNRVEVMDAAPYGTLE